MKDVSNGWNVSETRVPIDILVCSNDEIVWEQVEQAAGEIELKNRLIRAKGNVEAIHYLTHSLNQRVANLLGGADIPTTPSLILLDMGSADSHELIHQLRTTNALMAIPIVTMMDRLNEVDIIYGVCHGIAGYFLLPMDPGQLRKVVRDVENHWNLLWSAPSAN